MRAIYITLFFCFTSATVYSQIQKQWSVIHYPYGSQNNYQRLVHDQILLNSSGEIICGWNCTINDSSFNTIGVTSNNTSGQLNWFEDYKGGWDQNELRAISIDSLNNVYSMGQVNIFVPNESFVAIKYDANGNEEWVIGDDSIEAYGFDGLINNNNYYLMSSYKPGLLKYDLNGNAIDSISADTLSSSIFSLDGKIKSRNHNIYYSGDVLINLSSREVMASKINSNDSILWKKILDLSSGSDNYADMDVDNSGNLYILSLADVQSNSSYAVICALDKDNGDTLWTNFIAAGPNSMETFPADIKVDDGGNVYVVAEVYKLSLNRYQTRLTQFNASSGIKNWHVDFDSLYAEGLYYSKCFVDMNSKSVFVAYSVFPDVNFPRTCISKIDSTGTVLWKSWFDSLGTVRGFIGDEAGNLYIAGSFLTKFSLITGIDEQSNSTNNLNVYFNIESRSINVMASSINGKNYKLSIIDAVGRTVYNEQGQTSNSFEKSIPFTRRKDGLYLMVLQTEKERLTGKMVVY